MPINWEPLKRYGSAFEAFASSETARKRQRMLDRVKMLADLRRAGYAPSDDDQLAFFDPEGQKWTPVKEVTAEQKAYETQKGRQKARKDFPVPPSPTVMERERLKQIAATEKLKGIAEKDPNLVYSKHGYRMNDDGTLYLDPVHEAPQKLKDFPDVLGKRTNIEVLRTLGERWDDSKEIMALLNDPEVSQVLTQGANESKGSIWNAAANKFSNSFRTWLQRKGMGPSSKVGELVVRMQRFASQERKEFLGVAVTGTELESVLAWMPNAGDSFETIWSKARVGSMEGEQQFRRFLDIYKNIANMGPVYDAFGLKRFGGPAPTQIPLEPPTGGKTAWIINPEDPNGPPIQVWSHGVDESGQEIWDTEPPRPNME